MTAATQPDPHATAESGPFVHASAVVIAESGVLIRGASGAGKSSLALALIFMAGSAGLFARLIGDDRVRLERRGGRLIVHGHRRITGTIEWRGQGIFETTFLDAAVVGLVVDLVSAEGVLPRYPEAGGARILLSGVTMPVLALPKDMGPANQALSVLQHFHLRRKSP